MRHFLTCFNDTNHHFKVAFKFVAESTRQQLLSHIRCNQLALLSFFGPAVGVTFHFLHKSRWVHFLLIFLLERKTSSFTRTQINEICFVMCAVLHIALSCRGHPRKCTCSVSDLLINVRSLFIRTIKSESVESTLYPSG